MENEYLWEKWKRQVYMFMEIYYIAGKYILYIILFRMYAQIDSILLLIRIIHICIIIYDDRVINTHQSLVFGSSIKVRFSGLKWTSSIRIILTRSFSRGAADLRTNTHNLQHML